MNIWLFSLILINYCCSKVICIALSTTSAYLDIGHYAQNAYECKKHFNFHLMLSKMQLIADKTIIMDSYQRPLNWQSYMTVNNFCELWSRCFIVLDFAHSESCTPRAAHNRPSFTIAFTIILVKSNLQTLLVLCYMTLKFSHAHVSGQTFRTRLKIPWFIGNYVRIQLPISRLLLFRSSWNV